MLLIVVASGLPPTLSIWPSAYMYIYVRWDSIKLYSKRKDKMALWECIMYVKRGVIDEITWHTAYIYRWRKGRCTYIYIFGKKKICYMLYIYLLVCLSKQLGITISRTTIFLYWINSVYRLNWDIFAQLSAIYKKKAYVAINSIMHAGFFPYIYSNLLSSLKYHCFFRYDKKKKN
jgi:hypothetical protein